MGNLSITKHENKQDKLLQIDELNSSATAACGTVHGVGQPLTFLLKEESPVGVAEGKECHLVKPPQC